MKIGGMWSVDTVFHSIFNSDLGIFTSVPTDFMKGAIFRRPYSIALINITASFLIIDFSGQVFLNIYCVKDRKYISGEACIKNT